MSCGVTPARPATSMSESTPSRWACGAISSATLVDTVPSPQCTSRAHCTRKRRGAELSAHLCALGRRDGGLVAHELVVAAPGPVEAGLGGVDVEGAGGGRGRASDHVERTRSSRRAAARVLRAVPVVELLLEGVLRQRAVAAVGASV